VKCAECIIEVCFMAVKACVERVYGDGDRKIEG